MKRYAMLENGSTELASLSQSSFVTSETDMLCPANDRLRLTSARQNPKCVGRCAHSITSLASASSEGGTLSPSDLAALRLITRSYLVGACTGRSPGLVPLRIRST